MRRTHLRSPPSISSSPPTTRETELLRLVGQGFANREIAERLQMSGRTLRCEISQIYSKLWREASGAGPTSRSGRASTS